MKLKGIIDCDFTNYKEPVLTLEFPECDFKCDRRNGCQVCQNSLLATEPNIEIYFDTIWQLYQENPLTKGFCFQGLEPLDSRVEVCGLIDYIRRLKNCHDIIVIYTGYNPDEQKAFTYFCKLYDNIIIKWGRFILGDEPHYDDILGVKLASNNQYAEVIS